MAGNDAIHCSVVTPEAQVLDAAATAVVIPAHDGQIGLLRNRAPLLCELGTGVMRVDLVDEGSRELYVDGGFAQVLNNDVTILTERAAFGKDILRADAEKALADAERLEAHEATSVEARNKAIRRAKTQLRIASKQ